MITEAVRILADWSEDATYGVNAVLSSVPRESDVALPAAVDIRDMTRDGQTARKQVPDDLTGAGILWTAFLSLDQVNPAVRPWPPDASVEIVARIHVTDADTADGLNQLNTISRAVMYSVGKLMTTAAGEAARVRQQVQLYGLTNVRQVEFFLSANDPQLTRGVAMTVRLRDTFSSV